MSRSGTWGLEIALLVALATATTGAADPPANSQSRPYDPEHGSVLNWFRSRPTPEKPRPAKPAPKPAPASVEKPAEPPAKPPSMADEAAAEREREMQALVRRQMVCLKLMQIAADTRDDDLLRKAEQLDERARNIYAQRTAHLPSCKNAFFESDEQILEKHLGPANAVNARPTERTVERPTGGRPTSQAQNRGEMP